MGSEKQTAPTFIKFVQTGVCFTFNNLTPSPRKFVLLIWSWEVLPLVMRLVEFNFLPLFSVSRVAKSFYRTPEKAFVCQIKHPTANNNNNLKCVCETPYFVFGFILPENNCSQTLEDWHEVAKAHRLNMEGWGTRCFIC